MIALLQRVSRARVLVENETVGSVGKGLLILLCAERGDTEKEADTLLARLLRYRIFNDDKGKMNLSVTDISGDLLLVPQFTLAADTRSGNRPSFSAAAPPETGAHLFQYLVQCARSSSFRVETGRFGAHMQVELVNEGPVTFWLQVPPPRPLDPL
ncbi:MAG: D-tyrosyl-tRNA(Tyr) deacylase [Burkholderiaceae bacterium]|jgi:D-tyrosyl-tRNA(Tyr) deacylase|nr:D-tyrosyl-tRNA(Tyr) deacylase [Burkholderiaceae bacterium]